MDASDRIGQTDASRGGDGPQSACRYRTPGGALVTVSSNDTGGLEYECSGCHARGDSGTSTDRARQEASRHAEHCRALDPHGVEAAEVMREIAADVRTELSRIDTRAGAGIALSGAILIGTVQQTPTTGRLFAFGVAGAVALTISLLLFFSVLLPPPTRPTRTSLLQWGEYDDGEQLLANLVERNLATYRATMSLELSRLLQQKYRRLALALWAGVAGVLTLAFGVSVDLWLSGA